MLWLSWALPGEEDALGPRVDDAVAVKAGLVGERGEFGAGVCPADGSECVDVDDVAAGEEARDDGREREAGVGAAEIVDEEGVLGGGLHGGERADGLIGFEVVDEETAGDDVR